MRFDKMLWVDFETTGPDPWEDAILEVGAILTNGSLETLAEYSALIAPPPGLRSAVIPVVQEMHDRSGLWEALQGPSVLDNLAVVEDVLLDMVGEGPFILCGSGVAHFDRPFIRVKMPRIESRLPYFDMDWGHVRRVVRHLDMYEPPAEDKPHRALVDIRQHLEEARVLAGLIAAGRPSEG